jgi:hypothetical protein
MQVLRVNRINDIQGVIEQAKRKFGKNKEFALARWPDGSLRLVVKSEVKSVTT